MKNTILISIIIFFCFSLTYTQSSENRNEILKKRKQIERINDKLKFRISVTHFPYAKWEITQKIKIELDKISVRIKRIIEKAKELGIYNQVKINVIGYSDADGPYLKKLNASKKRAYSVYNYFLKQGFKKEIFILSWRADKELLNKRKPKAPVNRRVLIVFEGFPLPVLERNTGDRVIDRITEIGFRDIKYFIKKTKKRIYPDRNYKLKVLKNGVLKVTGRVISYLPGDKVFVRVRNIETPIQVNDDGTFEVNVVVYRGKNPVTFIQRRGSRVARRSDVINVISGIPKLAYQFQLKWDGYGDLDLIVEIHKVTIFYMVKKHDSGSIKAELDVDNRFSYGPENIRVYRAPFGTPIKVYVDYYMNIPFKNKKYYYKLANHKPVNYTLYVFDGYGKLIKTIKGRFSAQDATILFEDKKLLGTFMVR